MPARVEATGGFWISLAVMVLLIPFEWLLSIILAAAVHELGHILAIRALKMPIHKVAFSAGGVHLHTLQAEPARELICALAGPGLGLMLLLFRGLFPRLALCALVQGAFNLLPIYPFDGGRALRCVCFLLPKRVRTYAEPALGLLGVALLLLMLLWMFGKTLLAVVIAVTLVLPRLLRGSDVLDIFLRNGILGKKRKGGNIYDS